MDKIWAIVVKDLQDAYRFKFFLSTRFFTPVLNMVSFLLVYAAVFQHVNDVGYVQKSNYVTYLVTGFLAYNFFRMGWNATRLKMEKNMQTLEGVLLAPINRLYLLIAKALRAFLELSIDTIIFIILLIYLRPTVYPVELIIGIAAIALLAVIWISIDFVVSAIELSSEGIAATISEYLPRAVMLISAVYYPISSLPKWLQDIALLNPVYHAVILFRSAFIPQIFIVPPILSFAYLLILAITLPFLSVRIFNYLFTRFGIKGY